MVGLAWWGQIKCAILHLSIPEQERLVLHHSCPLLHSPNRRTCKCIRVVKWFNGAMWLSEVSSPLSHRFWHAHARDGGHLEGMRQEIRVEEDLCSVSSRIKRKEKKRKQGGPFRVRRAARWGCGQAFLQKVSVTCLFSLFCLERVTSVNIQYACTLVSISTYRMSRTKLDWDDGSEDAGCCDVQTLFRQEQSHWHLLLENVDWWVHP